MFTLPLTAWMLVMPLDGIANARARGVAFGRRPALTPEQVADLRERRRQGVLIKDLMAEYGLGKTALYRYLGGTEPALPSINDLDDRPAIMQQFQDIHPMTGMRDRQILDCEEATL